MKLIIFGRHFKERFEFLGEEGEVHIDVEIIISEADHGRAGALSLKFREIIGCSHGEFPVVEEIISIHFKILELHAFEISLD